MDPHVSDRREKEVSKKICATFPFFEAPRDVFEGFGKK
jgi:hypothetical protein